MFACGYNDRGQLGLGHRVNCPAFTRVGGPLVGRVVVQVACGAQHNLVRVRAAMMPASAAAAVGDSGRGRNTSTSTSTSITSTSTSTTSTSTSTTSTSSRGRRGGEGACEVMVWGNGALGQLGLGRKVTGRRAPAPLALPAEELPPRFRSPRRGPGDGDSGVAGGGGGSGGAFLEAAADPRDVVFVAAGANHRCNATPRAKLCYYGC